MDIDAVKTSYRRWAPIYDHTFGAITNVGRRRAARYINDRGGAVLEVGVGTGLSLPHYDADLHVTGIDFSHEMLAKADQKLRELGLKHINLRQMDARVLDFPDGTFDTVAAMHLLSVVPEPERVMSEIARVTKPGGEVVIVNHFSREEGVLAMLERFSARFPNLLGWHSDFDKARVLGEADLTLVQDKNFPPFGMMSFLVLRKQRAA